MYSPKRKTPSVHPGLTTLLIVIVVSAAALMTSAVVALRAMGEVSTSLAILHSQEADIVMIGCVEEAILQISRSMNYAKNPVTVSLDDSTCVIKSTVVSGGSIPTFALHTQVTRGRVKKCLETVVAMPVIEVLSWTPVECEG